MEEASSTTRPFRVEGTLGHHVSNCVAMGMAGPSGLQSTYMVTPLVSVAGWGPDTILELEA